MNRWKLVKVPSADEHPEAASYIESHDPLPTEAIRQLGWAVESSPARHDEPDLNAALHDFRTACPGLSEPD